MSIIKIDKKDLTVKEYNEFYSHPICKLFNKVNFCEEKLFKDTDTGKLYEFKICKDNSLYKKVELLKKEQKKREIMKSLGFTI